LANATEIFINPETGRGTTELRFPGMAFLRNIVTLAWEYKKYPSEIYQHYLENQKDIVLLLEFSDYLAKEQEKETAKIKEQTPRING